MDARTNFIPCGVLQPHRIGKPDIAPLRSAAWGRAPPRAKPLAARCKTLYEQSVLAVCVNTPGGVEQLELDQIPSPAMRPRCVRIGVRATALNRADLLQRRGLYPPPAGESPILGLECAGRILEVGSGAETSAARPLRVGDSVMALLPGGGYAEQVVVPAAHTLPMPSSLSFAEAAAIPEAFLTAQEALVTLGQLRPNERVLIHAAAGGVGSAAVQLATHLGGHVLATAGSDAKLALARQLGAKSAVHYRDENLHAAAEEHCEGQGLDLIVDFVGGSQGQFHQKALGRSGRWVVVGVLGGSRVEVNLARLLTMRWQLLGLVMRSQSEEEKARIVNRFRKRWLEQFDNGRLRPVVDRQYPISEVRAAHERMESNANLGKIVLHFDS